MKDGKGGKMTQRRKYSKFKNTYWERRKIYSDKQSFKYTSYTVLPELQFEVSFMGEVQDDATQLWSDARFIRFKTVKCLGYRTKTRKTTQIEAVVQFTRHHKMG